MPIYCFECKDCKYEYEILTNFDEKNEYPAVFCPMCQSSNKYKIPALCGFTFTNPIGTDKHNNSHDYRYYKKLEQIRAEKETASKKDAAYREIDDISCGKYFGEVS